ncbi:hypothetical protein R1sor_009758 [Riccia sorocarpa]|uniref:Uncharacterized protein n=1 Tax=Riccia sorocarpa TaxID=122646 RepID=A0ABD3HZM3_9MARC
MARLILLLMIKSNLQVASSNVRGIGRKDKAKAMKGCLCGGLRGMQVVALQELKVNSGVLRSGLSRLRGGIYLTQGAQWVEDIKEVSHLRSRNISDHVPIYADIQRDKAEKQKMEGSLETEVTKRRELLTEDSTEQEQEILIELEQRLTAQQLNDAKAWGLRCNERWLSVDDAPSHESLEVLEGEDGVEITDPDEILECIHSFYQGLYGLYIKEVVSDEAARAQEEVVGLISKSLLPEDSMKISAMPQKDEIERVVFSMKSNKAPGHDGVTIDTVRACWDLVG